MNTVINSEVVRKRIPKLCFHKATGQSYMTLDGRRYYLGRQGAPETQLAYHSLVTDWMSGTMRTRGNRKELRIVELIDRYHVFAAKYYSDQDGRISKEYVNIVLAMRPLKEIYALSPVSQFGPLALKTVREMMIKNNWCRRQINHNIGRIKRMFRWAAENELVSGSIFHALQSVQGLRRGRSEARESEPVRPVPVEHIEAIRTRVSKQVWGMIQMQLLTAARPGEICVMRPCDIDSSGKIWVYKPSVHKTAYCGHERKIYLGPRAQEVLTPFLLRGQNDFCFSPKEADQERRSKLRKKRKTPDSCGNKPGTNRKEKPEKSPGECYTTQSYGRAITYAIRQAYPVPSELARLKGETVGKWRSRLKACKLYDNLREWYKTHHWHPHQLRHNAATEIRKEFGLEVARVILGHRSAEITEVYAEIDHEKAIKAMEMVG